MESCRTRRPRNGGLGGEAGSCAARRTAQGVFQVTWNNEAPQSPKARSAATRSLSLRIADTVFQLLVIAGIGWTLLFGFHFVSTVPEGSDRSEYLSELWPEFAFGYLWLLLTLGVCAMVSLWLKRSRNNALER